MAQGQVNEFVIWINEAPVVNANADGEFDLWRDDAPTEDRDEGWNATTPTARRRVVDF